MHRSPAGFYSQVRLLLVVTLAALASALPGATQSAPSTVRVEITAAPGLLKAPVEGRVFVVLGKTAAPEPRTTIGRTGLDANPVFATDVTGFDGQRPATIDQR